MAILSGRLSSLCSLTTPEKSDICDTIPSPTGNALLYLGDEFAWPAIPPTHRIQSIVQREESEGEARGVIIGKTYLLNGIVASF